MNGRQSVRVTYAHKRRRAQMSRKPLSSPLEILPPETDDLTRTQMARRMLKRSRRVAIAEQLEDPNSEQIREHLAKRIKHTQERISSVGPPPSEDDITLQTPFSSKLIQGPSVESRVVPEQFSPVPAAKRVMSRTHSRNFKENNPYPSQTLASPFCSRPASAASSPRRKARGRSSHRPSRNPQHVKSRTLSAACKEGTRHTSRRNSAVSLKGTGKEPSAKRIKHQRYPSSPSTSCMRSQPAQEDWITFPNTLSRTLSSYNEAPPRGGSDRDNSSFYIDGPQFCSTPAISRLQPGLHGPRTNDSLLFSLDKDSVGAGDLDIEMMDTTAPLRHETIHFSKNSIFSSSGEFTIRSLSARKNVGASVRKDSITSRDEPQAFDVHQSPAHGKSVDKARSGAGSFVAEYDIPLPDLPFSPVSSVGTKLLGPEGLPKVSIGEQRFGLPGTSPCHGETMYPCRTYGSLTPPASPARTAISCPPSSPASGLALEFRSMGIRGDAGRHSEGETRPSNPLHNAVTLAESGTKKSTKHRFARNRASTIRATDFAKPVASSSSVAPRLASSSRLNVRRTRSGTVVGPDSNLATKDGGSAGQATESAPATTPVPVQSGSESESDDELLLKSVWVEDMVYLGLPVPRSGEDAEADELNLGGLWHGLMSGPPRRLGLRKR